MDLTVDSMGTQVMFFDGNKVQITWCKQNSRVRYVWVQLTHENIPQQINYTIISNEYFPNYGSHF